MATREEIMQAIVNADKAGDSASVRALGTYLKGMDAPAEQPAAVEAGSALRGIPRQLGLTARYGMEGLAQGLEIGTEPIRRLIVNPIARGLGLPEVGRLSETAAKGADAAGLPTPQGANERVVGDAARLVAGAGGLAGGARALSSGATGLVKAGADVLAANPGQQALAAAGSGLAGGAVREAGGSPVEQAVASMAGGIATPALFNAGKGAADSAKRPLTPSSVVEREAEQQIELVMRNAGIDWGNVPERVKQGLRQEVGQALSTGRELDPEAVRRLAVLRQVPGLQPTRGAITQDPVQITRERNLAKTGANSTDVSLQKLPAVENSNTRALLGALDEAGARGAPDAYATGQRVIGALERERQAAQTNIGGLYNQARDTAGRSAQLNGAEFTQRANQALDEALLGGALPPSVADHMNRIATGKVPFTVDYAEQLKTAIGNLQRASSDGQTRMALSKVRQALDETPLASAPSVNPGALPAVPGTVPPSPVALGEESISAFNKARAANRDWMQRVERTPALKAVVDGVEPDQFVQKFITGQGATVADVRELQRAVAGSPEALSAVRQNLVAHLKGAATNNTEDVTKFSPAAYSAALNRIGDRKLSAFFSPEEIQQLRAVGQAGTYLSAQPAGSAVNNSNSGAMLFARAMDLLDSVSGKLPLGLSTMIQGTVRGVQQGQALNVPKSLTAPGQSRPLSELLGYPAVYGSLLAAQPAQGRQDDKRP